MAGNSRTTTENIDEVILRLLNLKSDDQLDYQTYFDRIKKRLTINSLGASRLPEEEFRLLKDELKRVNGLDKSKRIKIKLKKRTVNVGGVGSNTSNTRSNYQNTENKKSSSIVKINANKALGLPDLSVKKVNVRDITEKKQKKDSIYDILLRISKVLDSILKTITDSNKQEGKKSEKDRIAEEDKKRKSRESKLEAGGFKTLFSAVKKLMAPFQSIWDRIINFFVNVLLGKIALKLLDWFADPKNSDKIKSMIRFVKDWWPALLGGYLLFGTSFGKAIRTILGVATKILPRIIGLIAANPLTALAIGTAVVATAGAVTRVKESERLKPEIDKQKAKVEDKDKDTSAPWYQKLGNYFAGSEISNVEKTQAFGTPTPGAMYSGGGYAGGLKNLFSRSKFDNKEKQKTFSGKVTGKGGPKEDKIPAMLSNGEFVMSAGAVRKWGVNKLEEMNAAGGGTNQPQFSSGVTRAAGGGMIGETPKEIKLRNAYKYRFGEDLAAKLTNDQIRQISNHYNSLSPQMSSAIDSRRVMGYDELKDMAEKMIKGETPKSFTQSSRTAAGLDDMAKNLDLERRTNPMRGYGENLSKLNRPTPRATLKPKIPTLASELSPSYFLRGQSSALPENYFLKGQSSLLPKPASQASSFKGPGLEKFPELQRFSSAEGALSKSRNLKSSARGGRGGMVGTIALTLAEIFKPQIQSAVENLYNKMGVGLGNLSDAELKKQIQEEMEIEKGINSGPLGIINSQSERLTLLKQESERRNPTLKGGAIKGGYGLQEQSFKDAPKTSIITDDKGRPSLGHKAMKDGKLVYLRSPQPGTGNKNPLEMLGRSINPGAYKENDARQTLNKQKVGLVDSLQSLQERGASTETQARMMKQMGSNLTDVQNDLDYRKTGRRKVNVSQNKFAKNQSKLEQKRPWWDKMGWMGGGSKVAQDEQLRSGEKKLGGGSVKLYNKPKPNTQTPYKSRFARPRNAGVAAPKPPGPRKPRVIVVNANTRRANSGRPVHTNTPKAPGFSSAHRRSSGRTVSGSTYGIGGR